MTIYIWYEYTTIFKHLKQLLADMESMKDGEYQLLEAENFTNLSYLLSGHTKYKQHMTTFIYCHPFPPKDDSIFCNEKIKINKNFLNQN